MTGITPHPTGLEPENTLDLVSQAVASMKPQTTAPLSDSTSSMGDADQYQLELQFNAAMASALDASTDTSMDTQTMQGRDLNKQQALQISPEAETQAVKQFPHHGEPQGAAMEMPGANSPSEVSQQEATEAQGGAKINEPQDSISSEATSSPDVEMVDHIEDAPASPELQEGINMLDKYAFNFERDAYNHHVPTRLTDGTTLYVGRLHPRTTSLAQHYEKVEAEDEVDTCPTLIPHELEMKNLKGRKAIQCVWVGMLPGDEKRSKSASVVIHPQTQPIADEAQVDGSAERKTAKKVKKGTRIIDLTPDEMNIISYDPNALRVVAKRSDKVTKNWYLYALVNPDPVTKLCQGWRVGLDEVFYFKVFRGDEAKSYMPRKRITQEKIGVVIFPGDTKTSATASRSEQPGSLTASPITGETPESHSKKPENKKTSDAVKASGGRPRDVAHDHDNDLAMDSPVSSAEGGDGPIVHEDLMADLEMDEFDEVNLDKADMSEFNAMVDIMVRKLTGAESEIAMVKAHKQHTKGKRVSFKSVNGLVSDAHMEAIHNPASSRRYNDDKETGAKPQVSQKEIDHIMTKMINMVMHMSSNKDLAALRQGLMMLKCIEQRCGPPPTSALSLYLNVPPGQDSDPHACASKLRELLDLFPDLEEIDMDSHVLAWMIRGLQLTGQSIDIELLPACLMSFSELFKDKFKDTANHQVRVRAAELTDMVCQARDDAEKMVEIGSSHGRSSADRVKCPSHPYVDDVARIWKGHAWSDPRKRLASEDEAESEEGL